MADLANIVVNRGAAGAAAGAASSGRETFACLCIDQIVSFKKIIMHMKEHCSTAHFYVEVDGTLTVQGISSMSNLLLSVVLCYAYFKQVCWDTSMALGIELDLFELYSILKRITREVNEIQIFWPELNMGYCRGRWCPRPAPANECCYAAVVVGDAAAHPVSWCAISCFARNTVLSYNRAAAPFDGPNSSQQQLS